MKCGESLPNREIPEMEPFIRFVIPLNRGGFRYMITGSIASILYGEIRVTNDVDMVVFLPSRKYLDLPGLFPIEEFYCPPEEVLRAESVRGSEGHFKLIHHESGFKCDIYPAGDDALNLWGLGHVTMIDYDGVPIPLAPPEYVIARKLEYFRMGGGEKHVRDVRAMVQILGNGIDFQVLVEKIADLGLMEE